MKMEKSRLKIKNPPIFSRGIFTFYIVILTFNIWFLSLVGGKKQKWV